MDFEKLRAPFPPERVSWRVGSTTADKKRGLALAYIDARDVQDRLDDVCGPENWQNTYPHANGKTVCRISIRINNEWIGKEDGAGDSDVEAEKGALSDAFKRAAVKWGIGRYLYDVDSPWVELEAAGRSYKIADGEKGKLAAALRGQTVQPVAKPAPPPPAKATATPMLIPFKAGDWDPRIAKKYTAEFLVAARPLDKPGRQAHYKLNEPGIKDLRQISAEAASYLDEKFGELP